MIKYRLKESNHEDIITCVLENRNLTVEDVNEILYPTIEEYSPFLMKDMDKAIDCLKAEIDNNSIIGVVPDTDNDGYNSSSMIHDFISIHLNGNIIPLFHHKYPKCHGVDTEIFTKVIENNIDCLIVPDAGSSLEDYERLKTLSEKHNVKIIILDHHNVEIEPDIPNLCLVNPHRKDCSYPNKDLSGCAVTYKFIQAYSSKYNIDIGNKYIDLVALSLISDMMDMSNLENRLLFNRGCLKENITSPLLEEIVVSKKIPRDKISIENYAFTIANQINATIRVASPEDKEMLFYSFYTRKLVSSNKRGNYGALEDIQTEIVRRMTNNKSAQDKDTKQSYEKIKKCIDESNVFNDKVIMIDVTDILEHSKTGLVANKLLSDVKRPVILYRNKKDSNNIGGSCRGMGVDSFKDICIKSNLMNFASGHHNSFGFEMSKDNIEDLREYFNNELKDINFETILEVDAAYNVCPPLQDIIDISSLDELWCNDIKEPRFIIKDVEIDTSKIMKIGNATYTWKNNNITFTKNFGSKAFIEEFTKQELTDVNKKQRYPFESKHIICDIVCRFRKNDRGYAYVDIVDAVSKELESIY